MLKLKDLIENYDLAKFALTHWEHDEDTLEDCLACFRISSNGVYPFEQGGRLCFLRLAPTAEKELRNLQGEMEFILYLRNNAYPALEPIPSTSGEYILNLYTPWGDYYATAFYGVEGERMEESDFSPELCFAYGKALGRLHRLSQDFIPTVRKQTHEDILELIEKRLTAFHCSEDLFSLLHTLRQELEALPKDKYRYGLIHCDFECDNVFFDAATGSCRVIDFDDGIYHFYALDVEQALESLREEAPEESSDAAIAAFLEGYRTEFLFDEAAEQLQPLMRRFCELYDYSKLLYCLSESVEDKPEWMIALEKKLSDKAEYLKNKLCAL